MKEEGQSLSHPLIFRRSDDAEDIAEQALFVEEFGELLEQRTQTL